jgi:hypothetical protein
MDSSGQQVYVMSCLLPTEEEEEEKWMFQLVLVGI